MVGCREVIINNGHVPKEYLEQAKKIEGIYKGDFEGNTGQIEILFVGDEPKLIFTNNSDNEFLKTNSNITCHSKFGLLRSVLVSQSNSTYKLDQADFSFDSGSCSDVQGKTIRLSFNNNNQFNISVLYYTLYENKCTPDVPPPAGPGRRCELVEKPVYLSGFFSK
jgi:hypothetical protein